MSFQPFYTRFLPARLVVVGLLLLVQSPGLVAFSLSPFVSAPSSLSTTTAAAGTRRRNNNPTTLLTRRTAFALDQVSSGIDAFYQGQPYLSAFLTCVVKASAADFCAQTKLSQPEDQDPSSTAPLTLPVVDKGGSSHQTVAAEHYNKNNNSFDFNWSRNLAFITYGGLYQGMAQQFIYNVLFPALFGTEPTFETIATKVLVDQLILAPFVCLPIVYALKAMFTSGDFSTDRVAMAWSKYWQDVTTRGLWLQMWAIWVPAQTANFALVPEHYRVAFVACVSFFWTMLLSFVSSSSSTTSSTSSSLPSPTTTSNHTFWMNGETTRPVVTAATWSRPLPLLPESMLAQQQQQPAAATTSDNLSPWRIRRVENFTVRVTE